jgi:hypothetical protein
MNLELAVLQAKAKQKTESEAYSELVDNDNPNPKPEDFESVGKKLPNIKLTKPHTRGRLGRAPKPNKLKRILKSGGPGSGRKDEDQALEDMAEMGFMPSYTPTRMRVSTKPLKKYVASKLKAAFNPDEQRDSKGRWTDSGGFDENAKDTVEKIARKFGFPTSNIHATDRNYDFKVGDHELTAAGTYDPISGNITLYEKHLSSGLEGVVVHEIAHHIYNTVNKGYDTDWKKLSNDPDTAGIKGMKPDGTLRDPEVAKRYPVYQILTESGVFDNIDKLSKEDGVSDYSDKYWKRFQADRTTYQSAKNETFAEVARIAHETETNIQKIAERNQDYSPEEIKYRQKGSRATFNAVVKPSWRKVFKAYMSAYKTMQKRGDA